MYKTQGMMRGLKQHKALLCSFGVKVVDFDKRHKTANATGNKG